MTREFNNSRKKKAGYFLPSFLATCAVLAGTTQAGWGWNRPPIKSYEIENKVYQLTDQSDRLKKSGSHQEALNLLRQAASFDPTSYSPYVHVGMADCYRELHQYSPSIDECQKALKFDPGYCEAYYSLALANYNNGEYDEAAANIQKLLRITSDRSWVQEGNKFLRQIETYGNARAATKALETDNLEAARKYLNAAVKFDPSDVSGFVHANLAYLARVNGKPELAIEEGKKALKYKPDDKAAMYGLAICHQDIGKYDEAIGWLRRYLGIESDPQKRKRAGELIANLQDDKKLLNEADDKLPDYLDHMIPAGPMIRWPQKALPIKVHINDGRGLKGFRSQFVSYIPRAMNTWCNASGSKLCWKQVDRAEDADIDIVWISTPVLLSEGGRQRTKQGVARVQTDGKEDITTVRIEIDTMHSFDPARALEDSACASVCMHELGHALGLDHCSNYCDLMFFGSSSRQTGLPTRRDRATLARLYADYPVSKQAPSEQLPAPMKFLPPPAFMPPLPQSDEDLTPPVFLPPPLVPESEKLTPPFFKPAPLPATPESSTGSESKKPPPPLFTPPPLGAPAASGKKPVKKPEKKTEPVKTPFFTPPPLK
jgi:tetratricopeptide (TPR) repeat protein